MSKRFTSFAVFAAALTLTACQDSPAPMEPNGPSLARSNAQDRLEALFARTSPAVMELPGTVFADNDENAGKLVFGVENANAARGVAARLSALGVSSSDYSIVETAPIENMATLRDRFRPTQAGIQIHFGQYVCTMGFNVTHGTERSFITNSHCTNTQGGVEGTTYAQPTRTIDPTVIATEVEDPLYWKGAGCPRGKKCRYSDAARANYSADVASNQGEIRNTDGVNTGSLTTTGIFTVTAQDNNTTNFALGTVLNKVGRTTGWSQGKVSRTCTNTNVSGSTVHQLCQTFVDAAVDGGDSGSPVFSITSGTNVTLVGILWGGGTGYFVMSPLANIQRSGEIGPVTATK